MKTANEVREAFLNYFEERGHRRVKSSSLVPQNDPTLLFTNAGMNQFKDVFLGMEMRDYKRAASSQKCMRVSGKHNDLETVGRTARHHTFFEMLGNFSFGDYFKKEAIEFAWELCTGVYGLSPERLVVTVFREDDDAYRLWKEHIGVPEGRLFRMGEEENFWAMGETGPCGPCSELHYDMGDSSHTGYSFESDPDRFTEIWNLVFMQFNRDSSGQMKPLPSPSIDTGMGLERIACVLQDVKSNYETDLFRPIIDEASRLTGVAYGQDESRDVSLRILADHSRSCAFLVHDGIVPGNEGRGYVLRKILRRAIRHGKMLRQTEPFIFTLTSLVAQLMKDAYPELENSREYAAKIVKHEEEKFSATLTCGLQLLDEIIEKVGKQGQPLLPGSELFRLYDTYGFPLDLVREIAQERRLQIDERGFEQELQKQRERARASWKGGEKSVKKIYQELASRGLDTQFTGYDRISDLPGQVLAIVKGEDTVEELREGETGEVILDQTPFYAESGGQVGDRGTLISESVHARVEDVYGPLTGLRLHKVTVQQGVLRVGDRVSSNVFSEERQATARSHTVTHLLHAALREVLGEHVKQAGSLVAPDRTRFDFSHYKSLTADEIQEIEEMVNRKIRENIQVQTEIRDLESALQQGAMALFGEKYQQNVRVVTIPGFSQELCGGTHVSRSGDISLFKIVNESSISAGVRRVEAITGERALKRFLKDEALVDSLSGELHVGREDLVGAIAKISRELKEANKQIEQLQLKLAQKQTGDVLAEAREIAGIRVLSQRVENLDRNALRSLADQLKNKLKSGVVVLGMPFDGKASLVAMVSSDLTDRIKADELIRRIAPLIGGGGGGKADWAEAGGKDPARLDEALEETYRVVEEALS
ncbi:MAG: alanine--tRNA ligase [Acidobacteriota bacterium]